MTDPYSNSIVVDFEDGDISLDRVPLSISDVPNPRIVHTILEGETLQNIAFKYYGDSGRWTDIADINSIYDAFEDLEAGNVLYIP